MKTFEGYHRGINLGGWFSQCDHSKERYDSFIRKEDLSSIRDLGFDHVRVPIDYELLLDGSFQFKEDGLRRIEDCIGWCEEFGLNMIIDLHKTPGFSFDEGEKESGFFENESYQKIFYEIWETLAKRFGKEEHVAFELLNEVSEKRFADTWNHIVRNAIEKIRVYAPDSKILVGGYHNNAIEALKDLDAPYDENIVYNFHCYAPLVFTHQGAYWIKNMDQSFRMSFDSSYDRYREYTKKMIAEDFDDHFPSNDEIIDERYFDSLFEEALRVAEERNVALYCGEFGVIDRADPEETLKWFTCIGKTFKKYGIGRCLWSYKEMDFGLTENHYDKIRKEILELI